MLQSSNWAKVKSGWGSELIGFFDDDQLEASCLILSRQLPLGFTMLYIPRGLAIDYSDGRLLAYVLSELKKYGKSQKALFIKMDPALPYSSELISQLTVAGLKWTGRTADMHETIQPRFNAVVHKEDWAEDRLDKKTQQFLRKARESYPTLTLDSRGEEDDLEAFAELMKMTEARKSVNLRDADYFRKLVKIYGQDALICLVDLDLEQLQEEAEEKVQKLEENLAKIKNPKRRKSLTDESNIAKKTLSDLKELKKNYGDEAGSAPVAGTLTLRFGDRAETLYAGTNTAFQKYYPSYLAWCETIEKAFTDGVSRLNMGGLENSLSENDGLLKFKKHFNPRIEEYIGEFDLPVAGFPLYQLGEWLYKRRKG